LPGSVGSRRYLVCDPGRSLRSGRVVEPLRRHVVRSGEPFEVVKAAAARRGGGSFDESAADALAAQSLGDEEIVHERDLARADGREGPVDARETDERSAVPGAEEQALFRGRREAPEEGAVAAIVRVHDAVEALIPGVERESLVDLFAPDGSDLEGHQRSTSTRIFASCSSSWCWIREP